jgi:hypothetical protein
MPKVVGTLDVTDRPKCTTPACRFIFARAIAFPAMLLVDMACSADADKNATGVRWIILWPTSANSAWRASTIFPANICWVTMAGSTYGSHPNNLGFTRQAEIFAAVLAPL